MGNGQIAPPHVDRQTDRHTYISICLTSTVSSLVSYDCTFINFLFGTNKVCYIYECDFEIRKRGENLIQFLELIV